MVAAACCQGMTDDERRSKLIAALQDAAPACAVVVLSLADDVRTRKRLLGAGAAAFVSMHEVKERLLQVIRHAVDPRPAEPERGPCPAGILPSPKNSGAH